MPLLLIFAAVCLCLIAPVAGLLARPPQPSFPVLMVVPPWRSADRVIAAAGGQSIGPGAAPMVRLVMGSPPDFPDRLARAGAWVVRDGRVLASLCGVGG